MRTLKTFLDTGTVRVPKFNLCSTTTEWKDAVYLRIRIRKLYRHKSYTSVPFLIELSNASRNQVGTADFVVVVFHVVMNINGITSTTLHSIKYKAYSGRMRLLCGRRKHNKLRSVAL